jgi:hypothetical protein
MGNHDPYSEKPGVRALRKAKARCRRGTSRSRPQRQLAFEDTLGGVIKVVGEFLKPLPHSFFMDGNRLYHLLKGRPKMMARHRFTSSMLSAEPISTCRYCRR